MLKVAHVLDQLPQILLWILPILVAVVFHEVAHGYVASWLGDDTARRSGRLTLNPLAHVDPIGTVVVPLFLLLTHTPFLFGWAKPVPVNFAALRRPKRDMVFVAAAGPAMNFLLAGACAVVFHAIPVGGSGGSDMLSETVLVPVSTMAKLGVLMNVFLGVFNLVPIPPLDGGRVLTGLLPIELARRFAKIEPYGFPILVLLLMTHSLALLIHRPIKLMLDLLL